MNDSSKKFNKEAQFQIVKAEFEMTQNQMDKYDDISIKIKTWAVTLWGASMGWFFQTKNKEILLLGLVITIFFWIIDIINKNYRTNYKTRRNEVVKAMNEHFQKGEWPKNFTSPEPPLNKKIEIKHVILMPHMSVFYIALFSLALLLFFIK